jgi:hypothetical protein
MSPFCASLAQGPTDASKLAETLYVAIEKSSPTKGRTVAGSLLLDALIGSFLLLLSAMAFFALFPIIHRSSVMANQESTAVMIANRMIDHLQMLKTTNFTHEALNELHLIDPGQTQAPYTFTNVPLDDASGYSPAKLLPKSHAQFDIVNVADSCIRVEMLITWTSPSGEHRSLKTGTIIGGFR